MSNHSEPNPRPLCERSPREGQATAGHRRLRFRVLRFTPLLPSLLALGLLACGTNETRLLKGGIPGTPGTGDDAGLGEGECNLSFLTPAVGGLPLRLGGSLTACEGISFSTEIVLESSAQTVELVVNGLSAGTSPVSELGESSFEVVLSNRGADSNALLARGFMADGRTCEVLYPQDVLVDCAGPSCQLSNPSAADGQLTSSDDSSEEKIGFQSSFVVQTAATEVELYIDEQPSGIEPSVGGGAARFADVTVAQGKGRRVSALCTDESGVTVSSAVGRWNIGASACEIAFVAPGVNASSPLALAGSVDACSAQVTSQFVVSTTAQSVVLTVNGSPLPSQPVSGLQTTFDNVVLSNRGSTNNLLVATGTTAEGETCETVFPGEILVDCDAPSCVLNDPAAGGLFFNGSNDANGDLGDGFQMDFSVDTDAVSVQLLVDGEPISSLPNFDEGRAIFQAVGLAEGAGRGVQALCVDEAGNETRSVLKEWGVDTTPCEIAIGEFGTAASTITQGDDLQAGGDIQLLGLGTVVGGDCDAVRVSECREALGSFDASALTGASWTLPVTLPAETGDWDVCAEVRDVAGNVGVVQRSFPVRTDLPQLRIVAPSDTSQITGAQDQTPGNATCDVEVVVDCADLGESVQLFAEGVAVPDPQALSEPLSAVCVADAATSTPYLGRAVFPVVALPSRDDGSTIALEAQQTVLGLVGTSTTAGLVAIAPDCVPPSPAFLSPSCGQKVSLDDLQTVRVLNGTSLNAALSLEKADGTVEAIPLSVSGLFADEFSSVDLGPRGLAVFTASIADSAGNIGEQTCQIQIVDEPTISIQSPTGGATLTTSTPDCDAIASGLQLQVDATTNASDSAIVTISIGAGAAEVVSPSGGAISACVDAPEGSNQILEVTVVEPSRPDPGTARSSLTVDTEVPVIAIAQPTTAVVDRRGGLVDFAWVAVEDVGAVPLISYELRCATTAITSEVEWDVARPLSVVTVPGVSGTAESETIAGFRVGQSVSCALRGADAAGALTPLSGAASVTVDLDFLQAEYSVADNEAGVATLSPLGDINGDGVDDFAYGTTLSPGTVQVFFGGAALDRNVDVTLVGAHFSFGARIVALGDVNADGVSDFAVSARTQGGVLNGSVYVFYGRDSAEPPWPAEINLAAAPGCGADLCFHGSESGAAFGFDMSAGDFDGDGQSDLVIGAPGAGTGKVYVLLGGDNLSSLPPQAAVNVPADDPTGFVVQAPPVDTGFGNAVAAVGPLLQGSAVPTDLVLGSTGGDGALWYLSATAHSASGLISAPPVSLIDTFVRIPPLHAVGDVDGDQLPDVVASIAAGEARVYRRSINGSFNATAGGAVSPLEYDDDFGASDDYSRSLAQGLYPSLGLLGDLDGDGQGEILIGTVFTAATDASLFYGGPTDRPRSTADYVYATTNTQAVVGFVGDINGDGFNDFAVLDSGTGLNKVVLHY